MYPTKTPFHVRKIRQFGQGMSEYLIIIALIAVAAIGVVGFMGDTVSNQMENMAKEISGGEASMATTTAQTAAQSSPTDTATGKAMATLASEN